MPRILILYSSNDGHTKHICEVLSADLQSADCHVVLSDLKTYRETPEGYDYIVIGAAIRYGHHGAEVRDFIRSQRELLDQTGCAFFSVNLVARKPEKCSPETSPYYGKLMQSLNWSPAIGAVFAGRLNYAQYGWFDRFMIRLIMRMTKGPVSPDTCIDYTDWDKVHALAVRIRESL